MQSGTPEPRAGSAAGATVISLVSERLSLGAIERASNPDWAAVTELAQRHRVLPAIFEALAHAPEAPPQLVSDARELVGDAARISLRLRTLLAALTPELTKAGIRFAVLKGPSLDWLYTRALRPMADLDLLIAPADYQGAAALLTRQGFASKAAHGYGAIFASGPLLIDLHTGLAEPHLGDFPDPAELISRGRPRQASGAGEIPVLSDEDQLLYLLIHGFKHQWCRLRWIADVALLLRELPPESLNGVIERASGHGMRRLVTIGLSLAREVFPGQAPLERGRIASPIVSRYAARLFDPGLGIAFKLENALLHLLVLEGWAKRTRYIGKRTRSLLRKI